MNEWKDDMKGERNTSTGDAKVELYKRYYDISNTIKIAGAVDPHNQDSNVYNEERINDANQRNAPFCTVINDGIDNLFVLVSHGGGQTFSQENIIYPGDFKEYFNVYALRLRSPTQGLPYRVSEYYIQRTCCPSSVISSISSSITNPNWIHDAAITAPVASQPLVAKTVGKTGYFYGFLISTQEANDFLINWVSGGISYSIRIVFGAKGSTQDTETIPLNSSLPADAGSIITITNVTAGSVGAIYQARLLFAEV